MLEKPHLVNALVFMERVTVQGKEALAWAQTFEAVQAEIKRIDDAALAAYTEKATP